MQTPRYVLGDFACMATNKIPVVRVASGQLIAQRSTDKINVDVKPLANGTKRFNKRERHQAGDLFPKASLRRVRFKIFPNVFLGSSLRISKSLGHLYGAS